MSVSPNSNFCHFICPNGFYESRGQKIFKIPGILRKDLTSPVYSRCGVIGILQYNQTKLFEIAGTLIDQADGQVVVDTINVIEP